MTENSQNYLDLLNKEQRNAVQQTDGSLLVLAGAGSGKTRVLTFRILNILMNKLATPRQILAVTFTNKAASEMKSRIGDALNFPIDNMWVGTFHSLSLRILRQHYEEVGLRKNFLIIDVDDQLKLIKNISYYNDLLDKITFAELFSVHSPWFEEYKDLYQPLSKKTLMLGKKISEDELAAYLDEAKLIQNYVQTLMKDSKVDAWIAPVAPDFAPLGLKTTGDYRMNSIWSLTGLPVITIPTGVNNENLPYSLQIIGNFGEDEKLLQISKMIVKNLNNILKYYQFSVTLK